MISLQQQLLERLKQSTDLGDLKPSRVQQVPADSFHSITDQSLYTTYLEALTSEKQQQNLWAIFTYPKAVERDEQIIQLFYHVCNFFESPEQIVEYNAILCATEISKKYGVQIENILVPALLNRISNFPSIEYAICFTNIVPSIPICDIKEKVLPKLVELMKNGDNFQHIASMMFCSLPLNTIGLNVCILDDFLMSPVFVANYLPSAAKMLLATFGSQFMTTTLIQKLLPMTNSREYTREGAIHTIFQCIDQIVDQSTYIFILTAFGWGATNDSIALALISHSNMILALKPDFFSKYREFIMKISSSKDSANKIKLCQELSNCTLIFKGTKWNFKAIFKSFSESPDIEVRIAFLIAFPHFYNICSNSDQDFLYQLLLPFFSDPNLKIQEYLMTATHIYSLFNANLKTITTHFLKIFSSCTKWRQVLSCMRTCVSFPEEIIKAYGNQMLGIINNVIVKWIHPLSDQIIIFYIRFFQCSTRESNEEIIRQVLVRYSQSHHYTLRCLFIKLASSIAFICYEPFSMYIWPNVVELKNDPVPTVRATLITHLPKFRTFFKKTSDHESMKICETMFDYFKKDSDKYVRDTWVKTEEMLIAQHYHDLKVAYHQNNDTSLPTLGTSITKSTDFSKKRPETKSPVKVIRKSSVGRKISINKKPLRSPKATKGQPKSHLPIIYSQFAGY
ncbi:hypothetical protein TRFO_03833 [Tritrichomonas foetus]|uniref:Uncharacterized protein n=1 Tax=Tritrichomonas foetus TaxID=1144522 RepID=A0A1J4KK79_9EUKA|nr:hypothetical protein TRFO_03833 [Tritrichomonas foetus]|eukprot:OHT11635.1 hypothetical protein TRFO_03833 [Tritrichomonas foetus]